MNLFFSFIFIAILGFSTSKYVELNSTEYAFDYEVLNSLDFGARTIVNNLVNEKKIPPAEYIVFALDKVERQELVHGADIRLAARLNSITGVFVEINTTFTVYYKYGQQPENSEEEAIEEATEIGGPIIHAPVETAPVGYPEKVVAYNYNYRYPREPEMNEEFDFARTAWYVTEIIEEQISNYFILMASPQSDPNFETETWTLTANETKVPIPDAPL